MRMHKSERKQENVTHFYCKAKKKHAHTDELLSRWIIGNELMNKKMNEKRLE